MPRLIARSMFSYGMLLSRALCTAVLRRALFSRSPPPSRAEVNISLMSFVKILPRWASTFAFFLFMVAHFECPDTKRLLEQEC